MNETKGGFIFSRLHKSAYAAAGLAAVSGLISLYWACGGTIGIATVGGPIEALAHDSSLTARLLALSTALIKFAGAAFALSFVQKWGRRFSSKLLITVAVIAGSILLIYGLANVVVGSLVLLGFIQAEGANIYALKWHVFFWDAYFVVWGGSLLLLSNLVRKNSQ